MIDVIIPFLSSFNKLVLTPEDRLTCTNPGMEFTRSAATNYACVFRTCHLIHVSDLTNYSTRGSRVRIPSPHVGTNSPPDVTAISNVSWGHIPHAYVMLNVLESNEHTMEYGNMYHTSFCFSHHLLLRKSVSEFLKLGGDRAISLCSCRDVSLLMVV